MNKADILVKNGRIIDPARNIDKVMDLAIKQGRIIEVGQDTIAKKTIDASDCIVVPGLIDHHGHINYRGSDIGTPPDITAIPAGVTTMVDCGCTGVSNCRAFYDRLKESLIKTKLYINVSPLGQSTKQFAEYIDTESWNLDQFETAFAYCGKDALGLKIRVSEKVVRGTGLRVLEKGIEYAERLGKRVLVHVPEPPLPQSNVLALLRAGDIFCHVYHQKGHTILEEGRVIDAVWKARERGVLFDSAHGQNNFSWEVAETAIAEGLYPDIISSDITSKTYYDAPVYNLPYVMSKFLLLGMGLVEVIKRVTEIPAKIIGMEGEIGTLKSGSLADVTLLKLKSGEFIMPDSMHQNRTAHQLLVNQMTILNGEIVYRNPEFFG